MVLSSYPCFLAYVLVAIFSWKGTVSSLGYGETCPHGILWFWFQYTVMFNCFLINLIQRDAVWLFSVHILLKFVSSEVTSCSLTCFLEKGREEPGGLLWAMNWHTVPHCTNFIAHRGVMTQGPLAYRLWNLHSVPHKALSIAMEG